MGSATFRPVDLGDAFMLAAYLRPSDRAEVIAASGSDVLATIQRSIAMSSHCSAAVRGGKLLAIFGLAPYSLLGDSAAPWMLGTTALENSPRPLTRGARRYIDEAVRLYPVLWNYVDARNAESLKLLRWLGFTIGEPEPYGVAGLPFHRFEMRRP